MSVTSGARSPEQLRSSLRSLLTSAPAVRRLVTNDTSLGIAEALGGALCLTLLGLVIHSHWGLLDVQPHPFWILVIAIALRYGPTPGYVAACVASVCYAFFVWVGPGLRVESPSLRDMAQPFFLLVGGMLVSELVRSQSHYLATMRQRRDDTAAALHDLTQRQQTLDKAYAELEKRLVTQPTSQIALYGVAKRLNVLDTQDVYAAIPTVVAEVFEAEACAVYEWREGRLELRVGEPSHFPERKDTWDLETGLIGRAFRDARVISIRERLLHEGGGAIEEEPAMMAGPLLDRERRPVGVVVVERLPFLKLNTASLRLFESYLDWFSASLANAEVYQEALHRAPSAGLNGHNGHNGHRGTKSAGAEARPVDWMLSRLAEECERAGKEETPLSVMFVRITKAAMALPGLEAALRRMLGITIGQRLRQEDVVGQIADRGAFLLILPKMREDEARALAGRIAADLRTRGLDNERSLAVAFGVATLWGEEALPERLLDAAVADAHTPITPIIPIIPITTKSQRGRREGGVRRHADQKRKPRSRRRP